MTDNSNEQFVDDQHRYRFESRIATGGMGEVWRATDTALGRPVAVKVLKSEYADDPLFRSRFETEARHAASLHHPDVASVYDVGESALLGAADGSGLPRPFLVMELVDGQPLSALLRGGQRARPRRGPRPDGPGRRRDRRRAPGRHRAPRREAGQPAGHARPADQDHRLRHRPRLRRARPDRHRPGDGHPAVPLPRAGARRHRDARVRRLLARRGGVRVPGGAPALRRRLARSRPRWPTSTTRCRTCRRTSRPTWPRSYAGRWPRSADQRYADGDAFAAALRDPAARGREPAAATAYAPTAPSSEHTQVLPPVPPPVPSHAGPDAHPDTGRRARPPTGDRRSPWLVVLLVLALVAAIILIIVVATQADNDDDDPTVSDTAAARRRRPRPPPRTPRPRRRARRRPRCRSTRATTSAATSTRSLPS